MHFFVWKGEKLMDEFEDVKGHSFMLYSAEGGG